jgi:archaellum component FlaC
MSSARARLPGTMSELEDIRQQLHVTQSNHTQRLTRIEDRLGRVDEALGRVETDFRGKLDTIVAMLDRLMPPPAGLA